MGYSGKPTFGNNVRQFREALGMTQENLAEASGLDRSYIGGVERGERNPTLTAILRLASALRIGPGLLFDGIGADAQMLDHPDGITAVAIDDRLLIRFKYDQHNAEYQLMGATRREFDEVVRVLKTVWRPATDEPMLYLMRSCGPSKLGLTPTLPICGRS